MGLLRLIQLCRLFVIFQAIIQPSQSGLTEANLLRHNQADYAPTRPIFAGKVVTVNNRFVISCMVICNGYM